MNNIEPSDCGVVYIATGNKYVKEAEISARSLAKHNDIHTTLLTDKKRSSKIFDRITTLDIIYNNQGDSVLSFDQILYDKTLFLDTDTYICSSIEEIFTSLNNFDIACSLNVGFIDQYQDLKKESGIDASTVPLSMYELNTGVIGIKKNERTKEMLSRWNELYNAQTTETRNQQAFRQAVYETNVRLLTLPRNYNYRLPKVATVEGKIKIIHGRHPCSYEEIEKYINQTEERRVITKADWPLGVNSANKTSLRFKLEYNIRHHGIKDTIKKGINRYIK